MKNLLNLSMIGSWVLSEGKTFIIEKKRGYCLGGVLFFYNHPLRELMDT